MADTPMPREEALAFARRIALARLAARAHSVAELRAVLVKKSVPADVQTVLLARLMEVGLLDDEVFAQEWVRSRHSNRNVSLLVLRRELHAKGIADELIETALAQFDAGDERAAALAVAQKRMRSLGGLETHVMKRRLAGALIRRGFSSCVIGGVISEVMSSPASGEVSDFEGL